MINNLDRLQDLYECPVFQISSMGAEVGPGACRVAHEERSVKGSDRPYFNCLPNTGSGDPSSTIKTA